MEKFERAFANSLDNLSVKEILNHYKEMAKEVGEVLTHAGAKRLYNQSKKRETYINDIYQVDVYRGKDADMMVLNDEWKGKSVYLAIKRHDKEICNDWRDFQQIKNELVGEDIEAMQIYPAEQRCVDTANQYWLFCLPKGQWIPFGFTERLVDYTEKKGGYNKVGQRGVA